MKTHLTCFPPYYNLAKWLQVLIVLTEQKYNRRSYISVGVTDLFFIEGCLTIFVHRLLWVTWVPSLADTVCKKGQVFVTYFCIELGMEYKTALWPKHFKQSLSSCKFKKHSCVPEKQKRSNKVWIESFALNWCGFLDVKLMRSMAISGTSTFFYSLYFV